jgi:hypothetical protein
MINIKERLDPLLEKPFEIKRYHEINFWVNNKKFRLKKKCCY